MFQDTYVLLLNKVEICFANVALLVLVNYIRAHCSVLDKLEPLAGNSGFCGDTVSLSIISEKITSPKYSARLRLKILISYPQNMSSLAILEREIEYF